MGSETRSGLSYFFGSAKLVLIWIRTLILFVAGSILLKILCLFVRAQVGKYVFLHPPPLIQEGPQFSWQRFLEEILMMVPARIFLLLPLFPHTSIIYFLKMSLLAGVQSFNISMNVK